MFEVLFIIQNVKLCVKMEEIDTVIHTFKPGDPLYRGITFKPWGSGGATFGITGPRVGTGDPLYYCLRVGMGDLLYYWDSLNFFAKIWASR